MKICILTMQTNLGGTVKNLHIMELLGTFICAGIAGMIYVFMESLRK